MPALRYASSLWRRVGAAAACAILAAAAAGPARAAQPLTYTDILKQLTDLDRLGRLQPAGTRAGLASSWDRNGLRVWGANGDAGQYQHVEPNGEAVMMDVDGPGCIYRLWSANPQGRIRVYLDGDKRPTYEWDHASLYTGSVPPFIKPLVYQRGDWQSASDCYLPIPFSTHIKVTADRAHGQYYHLNYLTFPRGTQVASFRLPLTGAEQAALDAAADAWAHPGRDPKPALPGQRTITRSFTIRPGQSVALADLRGPGQVRAIRVRASSDQRYYWRKLVLQGAWDDAAWPQVLTPLGPLFGFDWETPEYGSLVAGCQGGQCYFYYPMPFRARGRLKLMSRLEKPAKVSVDIEWAPVSAAPADMAYFFARWRQERDSTTFDYPFVEAAGRGHFVGVAMPIDHPLGGWWGEGDEKVWVDGDLYPPWIGTGSEDYFGDAWGIRYLPGPSFGCASFEGHRTCNYRWHFMDLIPFEQRFRMTIENYGPNGGGPRGQYAYSSTAMWYQAELQPPFEQLRGHFYVGGEDPNQKPAPYEYHGNLFTDLDAEALRTYGTGITFAVEAEDALAGAVAAHRARIITDARLPYEFSRERAVDFGTVKAGQVLADFTMKVADGGVFFPLIYTAPGNGIADVALEVGGKRLATTGRRGANALQLSGIRLAKGDAKLRLTAATDGRAVVDCLQLETVRHEDAAIEAEDLQVVRVSRGAPQPEVTEPNRDASAGATLVFRPTRQGAGVTLRLPSVPPKPYALGMRPMLGPSSGIVQAFAGRTAIGPRFDLYAPQPKRADVVYPLGAIPADGQFELRVVGKNPVSSGYEAAVDYFHYEPRIIGPETADGIWGRVIGVRGAEYRIQDVGDQWNGGHQLWIQPSSPDATVDIGIQVPVEGDYEVLVRCSTSWDYATVQASIDGVPAAGPIDCYSPAVQIGTPVSLGKVHLMVGEHVIRLRAAGKNAASKGYLMGINTITVKPAK